MSESEKLWLDDKFGLAYDNEIMQKKKINTARNWGYDDGKAEGKEEERIAIAKNLLKKGVSSKIVSESTGLSEEEVNNLIEKLKNSTD